MLQEGEGVLWGGDITVSSGVSVLSLAEVPD